MRFWLLTFWSKLFFSDIFQIADYFSLKITARRKKSCLFSLFHSKIFSNTRMVISCMTILLFATQYILKNIFLQIIFKTGIITSLFFFLLGFSRIWFIVWKCIWPMGSKHSFRKMHVLSGSTSHLSAIPYRQEARIYQLPI